MSGKYQAPTVKKAFQILKMISDVDNGLKISELSQRLVISKSTVHGITAALEDIGVIIRDPVSKRYKLGYTLFELGRAAYSRIDLKDLARPFLEDLMERTQESVFLGVRNGNHVTILDIVESKNDIKITSPIGTTIPLLAGAVGKVFLSSLENERIVSIIGSGGLASYTKNSITDPAQYLDEIRMVEKNRYAIDDEEYISGVRAVAAPVRNDGRLAAAIWVVGFKPSLGGDKMDAVIRETKKTANAISANIYTQNSNPDSTPD